MDAVTLSKAMGGSVSAARYAQLTPAFNAALAAAGCTTPNRAAMWCAQVGHESLGLLYMEELASGAAYEGRRDLGNTQTGDGRRFKGRGPIQVTGRSHYANLSRWAHGRGLVPTASFFVDNPTELASDRYGFLGAVWYWTVERPRLNALSDAGDLEGATRAVNGGANGLADRRKRWERCRALGTALLPSGGAPAPAQGRPTLREGDTGDLVAAVQAFTNRAFPAYSRIDLGPRRLGPATVAVLTEFQRRSGIPTAPPFEFGPRSWAALEAAGFRG